MQEVFYTFFDHYIEKRMNYFDPLTRIPNYRMFQERMESSVKAQAIAIWHLDDLESYSSDYGYAFVDRMVLYMSSMLMKHLPPMTELYRTEPNCFIYVANDIKEQELIAEYFSKLDNLIDFYYQELETLKNIKK